MRVLVAGWFSFDEVIATIGDVAFVSGPISDEPLLLELCPAFDGSARWALNVSVVDETGWARFYSSPLAISQSRRPRP